MSEIYKKLSQAQSEFEAVIFDKQNPHFKSKYASLAAIKDAIEPALHKYGFTIIQPWECFENGDVKLSTCLLHESGERLDLASSIIKGGRTDQQIGCSITYQRRYQISSALFLFAEEDDDGEANEGRTSPPKDLKKPAAKSPEKPIVPPPSNPNLLSTDQVEEIKRLIGNNQELYQEVLTFAQTKLVRDIEKTKYDIILKMIMVSLANRGTEPPQKQEGVA